MRKFEIHITGSPNINEVLDKFHIKNIIVDLVKPNGELLRSEHMSSFVESHETYDLCVERVMILVNELKRNDVEIIRVKIESPYYKDYEWFSKYIESHFEVKDNKFAKSINRRSGKVIGTDRTYIRHNYERFRSVWKNEDVELCLYDTNPELDHDWLDLYGKKW